MKIKNSIQNTALHISGLSLQASSFQPNFYFINLCKLIKQHPYIQMISNQKCQTVSSIKDEQKLIKPKMLSKLVAWMQKLCFQTLFFSLETFEISVRLLKKYLEESNESPKSLQMLGCISLHIASKLNQKTIISIQSYIQCCMKIFDKNQFELKQAIFYQKIVEKNSGFTLVSAIDFIKFEIKNSHHDENQDRKMKETLKEILQNLEFFQIEPLSLACNLLSVFQCNPEYQFEKVQFLSLVNSRKFYY